MLTFLANKSGDAQGRFRGWCIGLTMALLAVPCMAVHPAAQSSVSTQVGDSSSWLNEEPEFLPVDDAFQLRVSMQPNRVILARWDISDGYYLYRHQFDVRLDALDSGAMLGDPRIPSGVAKRDEFFGDVEVYYGSIAMQIPVVGTLPDGAEIHIDYQGCADAGLCYPPETRSFSVLSNTLLPKAPGGRGREASRASQESDASGTPALQSVGEDRAMANVLQTSSFAVSLALFFIAGIGLAFTPCVFPMVPILSTIIVGEGEGLTKTRAFTLSLAYVLGMALTYALVGLLVGLFGAELNLQAALQSPWVLTSFAIVFVLLSGAMFGFYELALPQALQQWVDGRSAKQGGGRYPSVFVMGSLSSLVVSPCISAPLAGALIYLSNTQDAVLGGSALFALGLGMGVPLMIVGGSGGHWLPRAGAWMNTVKGVFGFGLLGVAVWLLERLLPGSVALALWAVFLVAGGVYLGALEFVPKQIGQRFGQVVGLIMVFWGAACLLGASAGAVDPFKPLVGLASVGSSEQRQGGEVRWQPVKSTADVESVMASASGPVILDLYADWCISCKVMERTVFPEPAVAEKLAQFTLLRADVTANDDQDQALLKRYGLFGPPSLVFFGEDGGEFEEFRVQGEVDAERLSAQLALVLAASKRN
ncbi:MAG: protein-disulfide reductase DsbD [Pseudomonadales bacterium]|nr:protein-disulfide reductase DsbD [Pseudomonadales bacterium]